MKNSLQQLSEAMSTSVYDAVKRANVHIQKGQERLLKRREEKLTIENYLSKSDSEQSVGLPTPIKSPMIKNSSRPTLHTPLQKNASKSILNNYGSKSSLHGPAEVSIFTKVSTHSNQGRKRVEARRSSMPLVSKEPIDLNKKADFRDLQYLMDLKSNKEDTEQIMRCVDIQHRQISNFVTLFVECLKTLIKEHKESKINRQNKRMFVLQNSMKVLSWINLFNPQNINSKDLQIPHELKSLSNYSKKMIKQYPKEYSQNANATKFVVNKPKKLNSRMRPQSQLEMSNDKRLIHITEPDMDNYNSDSNEELHVLDPLLTKGQQTLFPSQKMQQFLNTSVVDKNAKFDKRNMSVPKSRNAKLSLKTMHTQHNPSDIVINVQQSQ